MTDNNMPAEIWATPGEGDPLSGDGRSGMWSEFQPITNTTPYVRKLRWRTVGEDGMPEEGREVLITRHSSFLGEAADDKAWVVANGWKAYATSTDRWIYLDEVLEILG